MSSRDTEGPILIPSSDKVSRFIGRFSGAVFAASARRVGSHSVIRRVLSSNRAGWKRPLSSSSTRVPSIITHLNKPANNMTSVEPEINDIEELHRTAVLKGSTTYIDPATGFTVFTELSHLRRGKCCGNVCRHCPYGWENVKRDVNFSAARKAKLRSGDVDSTRRLLAKLSADASAYNNCADASKPTSSGVSSSSPIGEYAEKVVSNEQSCSLLPEHDTEKGEDESLCRAAGRGGRYGGRTTDKNVPYTRGGDKGTSQLFTGERRSKDDDAFEAMGTVDELCSVVGTAHADLMASLATASRDGVDLSYGDMPNWLLDVMSRLFDAGSHIAKPPKRVDDDSDDEDEVYSRTFKADGVGGGFDMDHIDRLEDWIDALTEELPELTSFILPTGGRASAQLHVARTVCRRAERRTVGLVQDGVCDPNVLKYLNRCSDFLFSAARWVNYCENNEEIQYQRPYRGAKQRDMKHVSLGKKS